MIKEFFKKIDGVQTISGIVITAVGGIMFLHPTTAPMAANVVETGIGITLVGLGHKGYKKYKKNNKE